MTQAPLIVKTQRHDYPILSEQVMIKLTWLIKLSPFITA